MRKTLGRSIKDAELGNERMTLPKFLTRNNPHLLYNSDNYLVLDFETTNLENGSWINRENRLLLACWKWQGKSKSAWGGEYDMDSLLSDIEAADFIVAHNAKFELGWLFRCGIDLRTVVVFDTMLAEWVVLGNTSRGLQDLALQLVCKKYGIEGKEDVVAKLIHKGVGPQNIPSDWLEYYCHQDVSSTEALFLKQRDSVNEKGLLHIVYSRCLLTPVLVDMEWNGVTLDKARVKEEYDKTLAEWKDVQKSLNVLAKENSFEGINWRSTKQVGEYLYEVLKFDEVRDRRGEVVRTDKGSRKTDVATIHLLKATSKEQKKFLDVFTKLSKLDARLSKSLNFFKAVCDEHEGTFYGTFNQGTTKTHRLSSSGRPISIPGESKGTFSAQLQNLPREYKRLFTSKEEDWELFEADSGQLEFRAAAILTGDSVAITEIINEEDVHQITADYLTAHKEPTDRQDAKSRTFRPLFAGTSGTKAEQAYCKFFQEKYSAMYKEQSGWVSSVLSKKELRTAYGMIYYWPYCKMQSSGYITHTTEIFNAPIQGFATAEVIPIAIVHAWHRLKGWRVKLNLTIHDSLVGQAHVSVDRDKLRELLAIAFTKDVYNFLESCYNYSVGDVPLSAGIKIGKHWGEGAEYAATIYPQEQDSIHWAVKDKNEEGGKRKWITHLGDTIE